MPGKTLDIRVTVRDLVSGNMKRIGASIRNMASGARSAIGGLSKTVFSLRGALAAAGIGLAAKKILGAADNVETWRTQLQALIGDQTKANQTLQRMRDFAAESPLATKDVIDAFVKLRAVGIPAAEDVTKKLGNVGLVFNKSVDQVANAFVSLNTRTLRDFGIELKRTGKTAKVMSGDVEVSVGNTTAEIRKGILEIFEKRFPNAIELVKNDFGTKMAVMQSGFFELFADLGERIMPTVKAIIDGVADFVGKNRKFLLDLIQVIARDFGLVGENLAFTFEDVSDILKNLTVKFFNGLKSIQIMWNGITFQVRKVAELVLKVWEFLVGKVQGAINNNLETWKQIKVAVASLLAKLLQGLSGIAFKFDEAFSDKLQNAARDMRKMARDIGNNEEKTKDWTSAIAKTREELRRAASEDLNDIRKKSSEIAFSWEDMKRKVRGALSKENLTAGPEGEPAAPPAEGAVPEGVGVPPEIKPPEESPEFLERKAILEKIKELNIEHLNENNRLVDRALKLEGKQRVNFLNAMEAFERTKLQRRLTIASNFISAGLTLAQAGGAKSAKLAKALALTQAIVSGIQAVQGTMSQPPYWPANAGLVASVAAVQAANVAAIAATTFGGGVGGGGGGGSLPATGGGAAGVAAPAATGPAFGGATPEPPEPGGRERTIQLIAEGQKGPIFFESPDALAQWWNDTFERANEAGVLG